MHIFVTGATGFIGSAVAQELLAAGYRVSGLARSGKAAESLRAAGVGVFLGHLGDPASLRAGIASADGIIHTAFNHDFSKIKESCEQDRCSIETFVNALAGSSIPLIVTSATGAIQAKGLLDEDAKPTPASGAPPRAVAEEIVAAAVARGVNASIVRLPPSVHGNGDHAFIPMLIDMARRTGVSAYVGEGQNCWSAVHRLDAAVLYRLVLEKGSKGGVYHGVAEEGIAFREIAGVIGRRLNVPVVSKTPQDAAEHFGWFSHFAQRDMPASSRKTQKDLGWMPKEVGLIADIDRPEYFL
ncbi:SDR family oxidoreductase [Pelobacter seleniigenes]|uniref:SDR family oxidoreductase n=1 Tax=Pelobacter seleniigenes TaxID=407188 RepID=UPI0004A6D992|nr:SDR family oxidoreductase [Pelobacter seleniigenes]